MNYKQISITDYNLMDIVEHGDQEFPIQYYVDELSLYPQQMIPLHWHHDLEFYQAIGGTVKIKIQNQIIDLQDGEAIFINKNIFHSFQQSDPHCFCTCPNIVFSSHLIAPWNSNIYTNYIEPILLHSSIPYIIFNQSNSWHQEILIYLDKIFSLLQKYGKIPQYYGAFPILPFKYKNIESDCYELDIQILLAKIWKIMYSHFNQIPFISLHSPQQSSQIRLHKMLEFIEDNYQKKITLNEIANVANISKSEASRCFHNHLHTSPIDYLIKYRMEKAIFLLTQTNESITSIAYNCGFHSPSYFNKRFAAVFHCSPKQYRNKSTKF